MQLITAARLVGAPPHIFGHFLFEASVDRFLFHRFEKSFKEVPSFETMSNVQGVPK